MTINTHNHTQKMQRRQDYIQALEEERSKIQVFQRELPLCLELVTQAIETCKQQLSGKTIEYNLNVQSECSEQTCSDAPLLEEFMPIMRASSHNSDGEEQESKKPKIDTDINVNKDGKLLNGNDKNSKKSDWLRSVQLWNQTPDPPSKEDSPVNKNGSGGAFHPFKKDIIVGTCDATIVPPVNRAAQPASTIFTAGTGGSSGGGGNKKLEDKEGQCHRKSRRCWSPELHKRFLQALQQLGGSHLATPKQIRELMKVDGLTNDEVKSHLQKYRLHSRRPSPSIHNNNNNNNNTQTPQFVVVGGIWVPPEYATMATTTTSGEANSTGIYAQVTTLATAYQDGYASASPKERQEKPRHSDDRGSHCDKGRAQSHSPTTSSTHTTTASQPY